MNASRVYLNQKILTQIVVAARYRGSEKYIQTILEVQLNKDYIFSESEKLGKEDALDGYDDDVSLSVLQLQQWDSGGRC